MPINPRCPKCHGLTLFCGQDKVKRPEPETERLYECQRKACGTVVAVKVENKS